MAGNLYRPNQLQPNIVGVRIALVHRDFTGRGVSHVGLGITSSYTAKTLWSHGIWAESWSVDTPQALRERIRRTNAIAAQNREERLSHVVLSAPWIPTVEVEAMAAEFQDITFVVNSHSNVPFLQADPQAIKMLRETADLQMSARNVFVGGNSEKFARWATEAWGVNVKFLPNLYNLDENFPRQRLWNGGALRLGLFGANRVLKNFTTAAAATVELVQRLQVPTTLIVSTGRTEGGSWASFNQMTINTPNLTIIEAGWLTWPQFRRLLASCHGVWQPSFTESFNVVSADAVSEGVPVVGSEAIDWLPAHWQANGDDAHDVARVMEMLLRDPNAARDGRKALEKYVELGVMAWRKFLAPPRIELEAWRRFSDGE